MMNLLSEEKSLPQKISEDIIAFILEENLQPGDKLPNLFRVDLALGKQNYRLVHCTPTILVSYKNFHASTSKTPLGVIRI